MPTKEPKDIMVSQMVHGTIQSTIMGMYVGAVTSAPVIPADVDATGAVILYLGTTDDTDSGTEPGPKPPSESTSTSHQERSSSAMRRGTSPHPTSIRQPSRT